jgi:hypothetical protein
VEFAPQALYPWLITMTQTAPCRWASPAWLPFAAAVLLCGCRPQDRTPQDTSSTIAAAGPAAPHEHTASLGYLISSAADDFRAHTPGLIEVRHVRFGLRDTTAGQQSYVLCGDFRRRSEGDTARWVPFATIESSRYEQWLGETRYCQTLSGVWNSSDSLTTLLQTALH